MMMKRLISIAQGFAALTLALQLAGCEDLPGPERIDNDNFRPSDVPVAGAPVIKANGSLYNAADSDPRYAAAAIARADGTLDLWCSSQGGVYGEAQRLVNLNSSEATTDPVSLHEEDKDNNAAIKNTFAETFYSWMVSCPSWETTDACFRWKLYEWKDDYETTLKGTPIAEKDFINYRDNSWLEITADDGYTQVSGNKKFPAGTYLLYMERIKGQCGFWGRDKKEGQVYYKNGEPLEGNAGFKSQYQFARAPEVSYTSRIRFHTAMQSASSLKLSDDSIVLSPTETEADRIYNTEPSVVKVGEYYYMAYSGTFEKAGTANKVFAARSTEPQGLWEKWNGSGWGGSPAPVIDYAGDSTAYGAGQPSLVVKDGQIYLYYSYGDYAEATITDTYLATTPAGGDWPASLSDQGMVIDRSEAALEGMDGASVKYIDEQQCFQAIHAANAKKVNSCLVVWSSADGITGWKLKSKIYDNMHVRMYYPRYVSDDQGHVPAGLHKLIYNYNKADDKMKLWLAEFDFVR